MPLAQARIKKPVPKIDRQKLLLWAAGILILILFDILLARVI